MTEVHAECAYILRYIEFTNRHGKWPWSLRQYAVYHKFRPSLQDWCSTWILVGASQRTEGCIDKYAQQYVDELRASNPLELHAMFLEGAVASWRPYLVDLLAHVTDLVDTSCRRTNSALTYLCEVRPCRCHDDWRARPSVKLRLC